MTTEKVEALIQRHIQRYPQIDIQDIYKLLHQAVFGPGHAITKRKAAQEWLEWQSGLVQLAPNQPVLESIHPEDAVVRLHLQPYLALNGNLKRLLDAFIDSSKVMNGDLDTLSDWWGVFQRMTDKGKPLADRFDARTVVLIGRTRANEHWPAMHHSPAFDAAYNPIYRILTRPLAETLLEQQKITFDLI